MEILFEDNPCERCFTKEPSWSWTCTWCKSRSAM